MVRNLGRDMLNREIDRDRKKESRQKYVFRFGLMVLKLSFNTIILL